MGYNLFDCVIPTREARHNRLYVFTAESEADIDVHAPGFYQYHYIMDDKYMKDMRPVSKMCDCHLCRNYSKAYLRHLYKVGDSLGYRLATIHNLRFYAMLMEKLRSQDHGA
jgi:queuine tRNA-ribosyltransferase